MKALFAAVGKSAVPAKIEKAAERAAESVRSMLSIRRGFSAD